MTGAEARLALPAAPGRTTGLRWPDRLASAMNQNPYLRVLVLGGLRDLACPIDGLHYSVDHMQLASQYRTNITFVEYESGHMMYVNQPDLKKMQQDIESFLKY